MWSIVKNVKTLELVWPSWAAAASIYHVLSRLDEGLVQYWEPYWDDTEDDLGIRFASESEDAIEILPGWVALFENGLAVGKRRTTAREFDPTATIDEYELTLARVYDVGSLADLKTLSENGHRVAFVDGRVLVGDDGIEFAGCWVVENIATQRLHAEHGAVSLEEIARDYGGELLSDNGV
jgi:hypothetical protein|uniref:Uncharacterized protein n=1 Tax=Siphoviridae sp. ctHEr2 TaxID=2826229 RepID=A0A8S5NFV4_9CAUD|nr:MAG TPA: hypothetical protein [Siphoviridae sp. ctHEr2]